MQLPPLAAWYNLTYPAALQPRLPREVLFARLSTTGFSWQPPEEWFALYQ